MKRTFHLSLLLSVVLAGCETGRFGDEPPPNKHAGRTKVLMLDQSARSKSAKVELLKQPPARPHKSIALMTCEGNADEEIAITESLMYRARMMGGNAVVITSEGRQTGWGGGWGGGTRYTYKGDVLVYQ